MPQHVRKNTGSSAIFSAAMVDDDAPTTTTKALLVLVTAPRLFATTNAKTSTELELETVATNQSNDDDDLSILAPIASNDGEEEEHQRQQQQDSLLFDSEISINDVGVHPLKKEAAPKQPAAAPKPQQMLMQPKKKDLVSHTQQRSRAGSVELPKKIPHAKPPSMAKKDASNSSSSIGTAGSKQQQPSNDSPNKGNNNSNASSKQPANSNIYKPKSASSTPSASPAAAEARKSSGETASVATATTASTTTNNNTVEEKRVKSDREGTLGAAAPEGISPEERAAVVDVVADDPSGAVVEAAYINVEELLRIAFQNLLDEYHLLNLPTYTLIQDKQQQVGGNDPNNTNKNPNNSQAAESFNWIQVQVMVRPAALGLILERLERIGIGTNVGTLSIFKSEMCRTASAFAHRPVVVIQQPPPPPPPTTVTTPASFDGESTDDSMAGIGGGSTDGMNNYRPLTKKETTESSRTADGPPRAIISTPAAANAAVTDEDPAQTAAAQAEKERLKTERAIADARAEWKNAATRLRIEQVREQIVEQASMTFDYLALLTVASILAGVGLITDNTVVIVASMLVSPIMGPVLGCVFGLRIKDWPLVRMSFWNECLSLLVCVFIGGFVGLGASFTRLAEETWPTNEMSIRGEATGLVTGIAVAIPSGMGVCLSILGGNTSSLVGVAISASLLPPAVNAGVCFVYALFVQLNLLESDSGRGSDEFVRIGAISFALTVLNIVCIWLSGAVMFEVKEVAPAEQKNAFWARDLKVARELNKDGAPKPVDVSVIRQGVGRALAKRENSDRDDIPSVRLRPPPSKKPNRDPASLDTLFPLQPHGRPNQYPVWSTAWNENQNDIEEDEDVRYVGLEDMGRLLGFDDEDDDEEDEPVDPIAVAGRFGWGRYI